MSFKRTILLAAALWLVLITCLHLTLNLDVHPFARRNAVAERKKFRVGFLPVTCHLTCPVTDFINKNMTGDSPFEPVRFNGWPELKEAFLSGYMPATFILAPLAMALREQGVPIKIVYLGHRDGTAMMVHTNSQIFRVEDLKGKTIAVPNRYSNQRLLIFKALREHGMSIADVHLVEMPPPDMPVALRSRAVDAITSGEPFMGQTELDGYGRVLYLTKDIWPDFISCVLAVHEDAIKNHRAEVQRLVDGIARSGKWLDQTMDHRMQASQFVAKNYYNQDPRLLAFVLSKPPDRVKYTRLTPLKKDFEEIESLAVEAGIMQGTVKFEDYVDDSFVHNESAIQPYQWEAVTNVASAAATNPK
ncbi:MAG TPA: ABC transporter substrate-binding protein [Verrucomicrobiae bacterium]|jgi:NitT/TauT family transport system substrate-binding protein|nr:ABC transporter substrate-binding protein [Verrucomicrobiae bacterium]